MYGGLIIPKMGSILRNTPVSPPGLKGMGGGNMCLLTFKTLNLSQTQIRLALTWLPFLWKVHVMAHFLYGLAKFIWFRSLFLTFESSQGHFLEKKR